MRHLIRYVTLRHFASSPRRSLLTVLGVVLGVALVFATNVINHSVVASFRDSVDRMAGKAELVVGLGTGVDEELLELVRQVPGVAAAVPVIQESVRDTSTGIRLAVLAVDTLADRSVRDYDLAAGDLRIDDDVAFLNDPRGVLLAAGYASKTGVESGDILTLETTQGRRDFTIRGLLAPRGFAQVLGGDLLVMDIYAAQIAFERGKRFDHIDVVLAEGSSPDAIAQRIRRVIGERASVDRPERRARDCERILTGFRFALSVASLVAMLVGAFIVYNALAIAVAQRRREIGILRAVGATRREILVLFVGEGLLLGVVGSALGLLLGVLFGRSALAGVGATISELYLPVRPDELAVTPTQIVLGMMVGIGASLVASVLPAWRASSVEPATAMRKRFEPDDAGTGSAAKSFRAGMVTLALGAAVAGVAHMRDDFVLGSSVAGFVALASAFFAPSVARTLGRWATHLTRRQPHAIRLGVLGFRRNLSRNAIAIAALGMALGNVISLGGFFESIKHNTVRWLERSLSADIIVFGGNKVQGKFDQLLPEAIGAELAALPGVEFVNPVRMVRQQYGGEPFYLLAYDLVPYSKYDEIPVVDGELESGLAEIAAGTGIAASESFSRAFGLGLGDTVQLQTPDGPRAFRIALVYTDYSAELGLLTTTRDVFTRVWKDTRVGTFAVYLSDKADTMTIRDRIARGLGTRHQLMVLGNADYKAEVGKMFDRSFALVRSMEIVAVLVALLGIVNTLLVSAIDRGVELGTLKAIGAVGRQVSRMFITEALLIGMAAVVIGLAAGNLCSVYSTVELLRIQMGWRVAWEGSPLSTLEAVLLAQLVAVIGAWLPMRSAAKLDVVQALRYE